MLFHCLKNNILTSLDIIDDVVVWTHVSCILDQIKAIFFFRTGLIEKVGRLSKSGVHIFIHHGA